VTDQLPNWRPISKRGSLKYLINRRVVPVPRLQLGQTIKITNVKARRRRHPHSLTDHASPRRHSARCDVIGGLADQRRRGMRQQVWTGRPPSDPNKQPRYLNKFSSGKTGSGHSPDHEAIMHQPGILRSRPRSMIIQRGDGPHSRTSPSAGQS